MRAHFPEQRLVIEPIADVPPRETSPATKSEEKRMFLQATLCVVGNHVIKSSGKLRNGLKG